MQPELSIDGRPATIELLARRPELRVRLDSCEYEVIEHEGCPRDAFDLTVNGRRYRGWRCVTAEATYVHVDGHTLTIGRPSVAAARGVRERDDSRIVAEIPGTVVSVHCAVGAAVLMGEKLLTAESMKLQFTYVAPRGGRVDRICFDENDSFEKGAILLTLVPDGPT